MRNTKNASQRRHAAGRELARIVTGIAARITVLTGALAALTPLPSQAASPGAWSQNPVVGTPPRRSDHAAAYDLARHRTVVFGGFDATFAPTADTFEFDGVTWSAVMPPTAPSARAAHGLVYDAIRNRMLLFGGITGFNGSMYGDTWEFDGATWMQRATANSPSPRMNHAMAFDVVHGVALLHGGRSDSTTPLGDTWSWDGTDWTPVTGPGPSPRWGHAMSADMLRGCCVLYGGFDSMYTVGETWEWDGTAWQLRATALDPGPRSAHAMVFDVARAVTVLYGGACSCPAAWAWDGATWSAGAATTWPRARHTLVYDAQLQRSTAYGGAVAISPYATLDDIDHYAFAIPGSYTALGPSCPGSTATPQLTVPNFAASAPAVGHVAVLQAAPVPLHAFFAFGWSDTHDGATPLPLDLASIGMPGCTLQVSRDAIASSLPTNGVALLTMAIRNDPFLLGLRFYVQAFSLDPSANAGGFAATNRVLAIVGN